MRWSIIAVPAVAALTAVNTVVMVRTVTAPEVNVVSDIGGVTDAQNWGADYMLLWLGGSGPRAGQATSSNQSALKERTSAPFDLVLPTSPVQVSSVRPYGEPVRIGDPTTGDVLWRMGYEAIAKFPGEQSSRRLFYKLDVVEHGGGYQVTALPRQVTPLTSPFRASTMYTQRAVEGSAMFRSADAFVQAYVVPGSGGNLGSTVSGNFTDQPLLNSPYRSVETVDVVWTGPNGEQVDVNEVSPGKTVWALITVKAVVSTTTYNYMQLPVQMVVLENGQWAVDSMSEFVDISDFTSQDAEDAGSDTTVGQQDPAAQ